MNPANNQGNDLLVEDQTNVCEVETDIDCGDNTMQVDIAREEVEARNPLRQVGPYAIERQIGSGAMGTVYQANHTVLKRKVALKVLPAGLTLVPERLSRFQREMEAVGRLDHPNVVRAHDAGEFEGVHFLAMELIDGKDLSHVVRAHGALDVQAACEIIRQTAVGLQHVFENNLVHRDIKPSNLILTTEGTVKILDLGIARLRHTDAGTATAIGATMGTANFIAPEQITGAHEVDIRADIYSLGCTLYMLLSGSPPFHGPEYETEVAKLIAHGEEEPTPLGKQFPADVRAIVSQMIEKEPEDRFQTPLEVVEAMKQFANADGLAELVDGEHQPVQPVVVAGTNTRWRRKKKKTSRAILVAAAVVGAGIFAVAANFNNNAANVTQQEKKQMLDSLREVAVNSNQIRKETQGISQSGQKIDDNTSRMADTLDELRDVLGSTIGQGELVPNPQSNREVYHNARVYEQRGNYAAARENYETVIKSGAEFVDVHYQFQKLLRTHEGVAGTRLIYRGFAKQLPSAIRDFSTALLYQSDERIELLNSVLVSSPDFAPAHFELSQCFSQATVGNQTLREKKLEREHLQSFMQLAAHDGLTNFLLDQAEAEGLIDDARQRLALLDSVDQSVYEQPVDIKFSRSHHGWTITFDPIEPPTEIWYRIGNETEFQSTGNLERRDSRTGKPMPARVVTVAPIESQTTIEVKYADARGFEQGPFSVSFDPAEKFLQDAKRKLKLLKTTWIKFKTDDKRIRFSRIAHYRDAITEIRYGFDGEAPIEIAPPHVLGPKSPYLEAPANAKSITVCVVFTDGEELISNFARR